MAETLSSINVTASARKSGQWKVVAGLAAALIFVFAFSGSEEEPDDHKVTSGTSAAAGSDSAASSSVSSPSREILWPEIPLEFLLTHNPFHPDVPGSEDPATAALTGFHTKTGGMRGTMGTKTSIPAGTVGTKKTSSMPKSDMTVQMLFQSARGKAVMIDDKIYHEGDHVNGFEIASIAQDGVTLRQVRTQLKLFGK